MFYILISFAIVIYLFMVYLGKSDKNKPNNNGFYIEKWNNEPYYESGPSSLHYTLKDDETVEINGFSLYQIRYPRRLIIPSFINSYPVTSIKSYAFWNKNLNELTLPNSITSIGHHAFYENDLPRVTIPDSVTRMGRNAFDWIDTEFDLGENSHYKIDNNLLMSRDGSRLFTSLKRKVSCSIPKGVITIEKWAFDNCKLKSVTIPESVKKIEYEAFRENNLTNLILPEGLRSIGSGAFYGNKISSVKIPASVTTIGGIAFQKNNLTKVTIPGSVKSLGFDCFDWKKTNVKMGNDSEFRINNSMLLSKDGSKLFKALTRMTDVTIPNTVKYIEKEAFYNNDLKSLTISNGVKKILPLAFSENHLRELNIPNSVSFIGYRAFSENKLELVLIGKNVMIIESQAFKNQDRKLKNVIIKGDENRFNEKWSKIGFSKKILPKIKNTF